MSWALAALLGPGGGEMTCHGGVRVLFKPDIGNVPQISSRVVLLHQGNGSSGSLACLLVALPLLQESRRAVLARSTQRLDLELQGAAVWKFETAS